MNKQNLNTLIDCKNMTVRFDKRVIINDVSLGISEKEIVTIIGPNGSGKTTLLRSICGLQKVSSGVIQSKPDIVIGYMPQKMVIDRVLPITIRRFLRLSGTHRNLRSIGRVVSIARDMGIEHLLSQQIHDISGGEMQRVMLARAMLLNPDLLILDEPTQGLDIHGQAEFYNLIHSIGRKSNCGILMVSHDLNMVMASTDRVICLNQHICCEGLPGDINEHPEYKALFGKKPAKTLALYTHDHDHTHDSGGCIE